MADPAATWRLSAYGKTLDPLVQRGNMRAKLGNSYSELLILVSSKRPAEDEANHRSKALQAQRTSVNSLHRDYRHLSSEIAKITNESTQRRNDIARLRMQNGLAAESKKLRLQLRDAIDTYKRLDAERIATEIQKQGISEQSQTTETDNVSFLQNQLDRVTKALGDTQEQHKLESKRLHDEIEEWKQRVESRIRESRQISSKYEKMQISFDAVNETHAETLRKNTQLEEQQGHAQSLESDNNSLQARIKELEDELATELERQEEERKAHRRALRTAHRDAEIELEERIHELEEELKGFEQNWKNAESELREEKKHYRARIQEYKERIGELEEELANQTTELEELIEERDNQDLELQQLNDTIKSTAETLKEAKGREKNAIHRVDVISRGHRKGRVALKEANDELDAAREEINKLQADIEELDEKVVTATEKKDAVEERLANDKGERKRLREELEKANDVTLKWHQEWFASCLQIVMESPSYPVQMKYLKALMLYLEIPAEDFMIESNENRSLRKPPAGAHLNVVDTYLGDTIRPPGTGRLGDLLLVILYLYSRADERRLITDLSWIQTTMLDGLEPIDQYMPFIYHYLHGGLVRKFPFEKTHPGLAVLLWLGMLTRLYYIAPRIPSPTRDDAYGTLDIYVEFAEKNMVLRAAVSRMFQAIQYRDPSFADKLGEHIGLLDDAPPMSTPLIVWLWGQREQALEDRIHIASCDFPAKSRRIFFISQLEDENLEDESEVWYPEELVFIEYYGDSPSVVLFQDEVVFKSDLVQSEEGYSTVYMVDCGGLVWAIDGDCMLYMERFHPDKLLIAVDEVDLDNYIW